MSRISSIVCEDLQNINGEILLSRYQLLYEETVIWLKTDDYIDLLVPMLDGLKYIEIPTTIDHYDIIMKIHFDVIDIMNQAIIRKNNKVR